MKQLRTTILAFLDKVDTLLTTEPVRLVLYGIAIVLYGTAKLLAMKGIIGPLGWDDSVATVGATIALVVFIVEELRKFVYSPQTYIEDLADENKAGHLEAHFEEQVAQLRAAVAKDRADAAAAKDADPGTPVFIPDPTKKSS